MAHPAGNEDVSAAPSSQPAPAPDLTVSSSTEAVSASPSSFSPAELKVLELPDDAHVRVKVDGQEQVVPVHEYRDGISREAVFTKRMQNLAEQRRTAETELAAQYSYLQQQAQALEQAKAYMQQQMGPAAQTAPGPADVMPQLQDLATVGDVQSQINQAVAQLAQYQQQREQQFVSALGQASQRVQEDVALERDAAAYNKGLHSVLSKPDYSALIKALPYAEQTIRYEVANMDPQSIEQAVSFTEQVAKGYMDSLRSVSQDLQVRQSVAQARAKLEPPAGSPPAPAPAYRPGSAFGKNGFDWNALRARAEQLMG